MTRSTADQEYQRRAIDYVRHVLETTGLSPSGLARKAKVDPSTITRNLAGGKHKYTLSLKTVGRIAAITGIDPGPFLALAAEVSQARKPAKRVTGEFPSENLPLSKIKADHRAQPRENLNTDVAQSYAEAMAEVIRDLLAFLHFIRAEHRIEVPDRHFETLRTLINNTGKSASRENV